MCVTCSGSTVRLAGMEYDRLVTVLQLYDVVLTPPAPQPSSVHWVVRQQAQLKVPDLHVLRSMVTMRVPVEGSNEEQLTAMQPPVPL
ncbi:hypothetical protein PLESTF_001801800 [Pleodorina starrii]|nr:hypothetical protein PLESTF_001801800 [Pleodorina starrii]